MLKSLQRKEAMKCNLVMPDDATTKTSVYGATLLSGILYCAHCGHKLVGSYCTKQRKGCTYRRPIYIQRPVDEAVGGRQAACLVDDHVIAGFLDRRDVIPQRFDRDRAALLFHGRSDLGRRDGISDCCIAGIPAVALHPCGRL